MLIESFQARVLNDFSHVSILIAHFFFLPKRRLVLGIIVVCCILPPEITNKYKAQSAWSKVDRDTFFFAAVTSLKFRDCGFCPSTSIKVSIQYWYKVAQDTAYM